MKARITEEVMEILDKPDSARELMNYIIKTPNREKFTATNIQIDEEKQTTVQVSSSSSVAYSHKP